MEKWERETLAFPFC